MNTKTESQKSSYSQYLVGGIIDDILVNDFTSGRTFHQERKARQNAVTQKHWGAENNIGLPPSTTSLCLRWYGYEVLSDYLEVKPTTPPTKAIAVMKIGSASHWSFLKAIQSSLPGIQEEVIDEGPFSGRIDYLFKNLMTGEHQVLDLKFVSSFAYKKLTRQGLPEIFKPEKSLYQPSPEHRLQVLQYMWAKRQQGKNVTFANLVYFNRDNGNHKEGLIPWDAAAENDINIFLEKIDAAKQAINNNTLPNPSVESSYICAILCPWRVHCEPGRQVAAGQVKKDVKRRPRAVWIEVHRQRQETEKKAEKLGIKQPRLTL